MRALTMASASCERHELPVQRKRTLRFIRLSPWPVHDHCHTDQADERPNQVERVRRLAVHLPTPQQRQYDEDTAVGSIYPPEVEDGRLKRRNNAVQHQHDAADQPEPDASALA